MHIPSVIFRCGVLSCALLSGLGVTQSKARAENLPDYGNLAQVAQPASVHPQPPASASTATLADTSATPNDATKPASGSTTPNPLPSPTRTKIEDDYRIGAGDVLQISVWKEPEASIPSIVVRPDGKITLPLLKDIEVAGLTPREAETGITRGLAGFITDANVTVIVTGINSKKIYIIGAVKKEGPLAYTYRMTIMQALTEAGGLTDYAKRKKIYVLRAERGKETKIPFDYDAILKGKDPEHVWLLPNDTLVVPH
jgi:polysaccharide export outer membrane protein